MLIISYILLSAIFCVLFIYFYVIIFNAVEDKDITAMVLAVSEIIQKEYRYIQCKLLYHDLALNNG